MNRTLANVTTLRRHIEHILGRAADTGPPQWPGDVFGVCMSALLVSGSYCDVLSSWPPGSEKDIKKWSQLVKEIASQWRSDWRTPPAKVARLWNIIIAQASTITLSDLRNNIDITQALLELCAISDEACAGVGVPRTKSTAEDPFHFFADSFLDDEKAGANLCDEIDPSKLRVLPKMRTPQSGLTSRSFSHNLGMIMTNEMKPRWVTRTFSRDEPKDNSSLNLLIIPWPRQISPDQFFKTNALPTEVRNMPEDYGFFTFRQDEGEEVVDVVKSALGAARNKIDRIDGVVVPEAALTEKQHLAIRREVLDMGAFLIAGGGCASDPPRRRGKNLVHIDIRNHKTYRQHKHHRWKLDSDQITQYRLRAQLNAGKKIWWEHIDVGARELIFVAYSSWLVFAVLICEDLARPDPVGDLVRAVGPNLVVALLMDGPQTEKRWGCRYAAALADDPGSSVLTVTSSGMSNLSRPRPGEKDRSSCIALWRQAKPSRVVPSPSVPKEIEITPDAKAVILTLSNQYFSEWTADGRSDAGATGYPLLSREPIVVP
jgi:hypothetical protein